MPDVVCNDRVSVRRRRGEALEDLLGSMAGVTVGSAEAMWTEPRARGCMIIAIMDEYRTPGEHSRPEGWKKPGKVTNLEAGRGVSGLFSGLRVSSLKDSLS